MKYRIITHGGCTDGYCSAFVVKKYFNIIFGTQLNEEDVRKIEVIGLAPYDVQTGEFEFSEKDIVLDLPRPEVDIFFWADHHVTNKPFRELSKNENWKNTPSCAGFLLELVAEKGAKLSGETLQFRKAIDIIDDAEYTKKDIQLCFYKQDNYDIDSPLLKLHIISAMFHTRDRNLNDEIFRTLLSSNLGETPLSSEELWKLNPLMFHKAQLQGYEDWRENLDTYVYYDEKAKCVVQDDRKTKFSKGVVDRFYVHIKFPQTSYSVNLRIIDEEKARFGLGSNIFHKYRCKIDLGKLCKVTAEKFGESSGGGHFYVGGGTISLDKIDEALKFILKCLAEGKIE